MKSNVAKETITYIPGTPILKLFKNVANVKGSKLNLSFVIDTQSL